MHGLGRKEAEVRAFLDEVRGEYAESDDLIEATCERFGIEEALLRAKVEEFRHCNCTHGERDR